MSDNPRVVGSALRRYDAAGIKQPVKINFLTVARFLPGLVAQFDRVVPDDFVALIEEGVVDVACPCGSTPRLVIGEVDDCQCGRVFTYTGARVLVARFSTPATEAAA